MREGGDERGNRRREMGQGGGRETGTVGGKVRGGGIEVWEETGAIRCLGGSGWWHCWRHCRVR